MIKEFIEAWNTNKDKLEEFFRDNRQTNYNKYEDIVGILFEVVINPYLKSKNEINYNLHIRIRYR